MITRVKGTQDFLDLTLYNFILQSAGEHLKLHHFSQIETPILESTELFKRAVGLETDIVSKEMFVLDLGKASDESICLRPEATASTVRAFIENGIQMVPWKVFSWGSMFRHERPQKGRFREFHQINMEVIGSADIAQDVFFIAMLDRFFSEKLLLETYALQINFLGCAADRVKHKEKLHTFLNSIEQQICDTCKERKEKNILRIFDCKNSVCQELYTKAPYIADNLCTPCNTEWTQLKHQLEQLSVSYVYSPKLVRGLDYYNKTVFEFTSLHLGAQNSFCGGGRYDQLVTQLGGNQDQPSIGAAMGIERLLLMLEPLKDRLPLPQPVPLYVIIPMSAEQHMISLLVADELLAQKKGVDIYFDGSFKSMLRKANKVGAQFCLIIGPDEQAAHQVAVKNMITGAQELVKQVDLVAYLSK